MPLLQKWSKFNKEHVENEPESYGVYELGDGDGNILYIGQGRVRLRLNSAFGNGRNPKPGTAKYRVEVTGSKKRAEERERSEIRQYLKSHGACPRFNQRLG